MTAVNRVKEILGNIVQNFSYFSYREYKEIRKWKKKGAPIPPPGIIKRRIIKQFKNTFKHRIFIETGTYLGETTFALKDSFSRIYSIELSYDLYSRAKTIFDKYHHISIIHGSSSDQLPLVMNKINEPCIFWLDGHYSGEGTARESEDTPIMKELECICSHRVKNHVILIDDARLFTGMDGYPTLDRVKALVLTHSNYSKFEVASDIIRIYNP